MRSALALALAWGGQFAFLFQAYWDARTKQPAILTLQHLKMMALATRTAGPPHVLLTLTATDFTELQTFSPFWLNLGVQQDARWTLLATARFLPMTSWLCWLCTVKPARNDESRCILQPLWQHELPVLKSTFAVGLQKLKALCTLWSAQNSDCAAQQLHAISSKVGP